jgi:hypothetical protein
MFFFSEIQIRYKMVAGSVCGFPKFVTSGSGLDSMFSKTQFGVWFKVQCSKIFKKIGLGFVKNIKISAKFP